MDRVNDFAFKIATANGTGSAIGQRPDHAGHLPDGHPGHGQERLPVEHPGPADLVRDPGQQARLHRADAALRPDGGAERRHLRQGRGRGAQRRLAALRLVVAARREAAPARHHLPRRAAGRAVQRRLQGRARAHPDEEHRLCRRAGGAARHRHRGHPRADPGEVLEEAGAARLERQGDRARLQLRQGPLRLPAADPARADGRDQGLDPDRRQHRRRPRLRLRRRDGRARGIRSRRRRR